MHLREAMMDRNLVCGYTIPACLRRRFIQRFGAVVGVVVFVLTIRPAEASEAPAKQREALATFADQLADQRADLKDIREGLKVLLPESGHLGSSIAHDQPVSFLTFPPSGRLLTVGGGRKANGKNGFAVWHEETHELIRRVSRPFPLLRADFATDADGAGRLLLIGNEHVEMWLVKP